jgi:hypothetical protein
MSPWHVHHGMFRKTAAFGRGKARKRGRAAPCTPLPCVRWDIHGYHNSRGAAPPNPPRKRCFSRPCRFFRVGRSPAQRPPVRQRRASMPVGGLVSGAGRPRGPAWRRCDSPVSASPLAAPGPPLGRAASRGRVACGLLRPLPSMAGRPPPGPPFRIHAGRRRLAASLPRPPVNRPLPKQHWISIDVPPRIVHPPTKGRPSPYARGFAGSSGVAAPRAAMQLKRI